VVSRLIVGQLQPQASDCALHGREDNGSYVHMVAQVELYRVIILVATEVLAQPEGGRQFGW